MRKDNVENKNIVCRKLILLLVFLIVLCSPFSVAAEIQNGHVQDEYVGVDEVEETQGVLIPAVQYPQLTVAYYYDAQQRCSDGSCSATAEFAKESVIGGLGVAGKAIKYGSKVAKGGNEVVDVTKAAGKGEKVAKSAFKGVDTTVDAGKVVKKKGDSLEAFKRNPDFVKKSNQLKQEGTVTVSTFDEANALRKHSFPDAQKVPGAGPKTGKVSESVFAKTKDKAMYKTDYLINPGTNRIYGTTSDSLHAIKPHINVKDKFGNKYAIIIDNIAKVIK